jgi:aconitate hydratase
VDVSDGRGIIKAGQPIEFADANDYDRIQAGDELEIDNLHGSIEKSNEVTITNKTGEFEFVAVLNLSCRERDILLVGGLLNYTRSGITNS